MAISQVGSVFTTTASGVYNAATGSLALTIPACSFMLIGFSCFTGQATRISSNGVLDVDGNTSVGIASSTGHWRAALHYIINPASGSKNLDWQWDGGGLDDPIVIWIISYWDGVDTVSPIRDSDVADAGADNATTPSLTAQSGDLIGAMCGTFDSANAELTFTASGGSILSQGVHSNYGDGAFITASPTGNQTIGYTATGSDEGAIAALVIKAAAGGGGGDAVPQCHEQYRRRRRQTLTREWKKRGRIFVPDYVLKAA